jgi:hypothetical protein
MPDGRTPDEIAASELRMAAEAHEHRIQQQTIFLAGLAARDWAGAEAARDRAAAYYEANLDHLMRAHKGVERR